MKVRYLYLTRRKSRHSLLTGEYGLRFEFLKVICSFANADGGKLIIGIDDKGKATGLENAKKLLEDMPNKIKDILGIIPKVISESKKGKVILVIVVFAYNTIHC